MVLAAWAFWSAPAQSQSFDCAKATTRIADWSVRFDMLQDGKLVREGSFAVGMTKGKLSSATAN
jgi:hypothetical protein